MANLHSASESLFPMLRWCLVDDTADGVPATADLPAAVEALGSPPPVTAAVVFRVCNRMLRLLNEPPPLFRLGFLQKALPWVIRTPLHTPSSFCLVNEEFAAYSIKCMIFRAAAFHSLSIPGWLIFKNCSYCMFSTTYTLLLI